MRTPERRIRKYEDKISGWNGLEVIHTGYKFTHYLMVLNYWLSQLYYQECDLLAKKLCEENNLDVVECERVLILTRKCCGESIEKKGYCIDTYEECLKRFKNWVKCEEIKERVYELKLWLINSYYTYRCGLMTSWGIVPLTKVNVLDKVITSLFNVGFGEVKPVMVLDPEKDQGGAYVLAKSNVYVLDPERGSGGAYVMAKIPIAVEDPERGNGGASVSAKSPVRFEDLYGTLGGYYVSI